MKLIPILILFFVLFGCTNLDGTKDENTIHLSDTIDNNSNNIYNNFDNFIKAKSGDVVEVHYTGKLLDGEIFDSSKGREPLKFIIDDGRMIKGFNDAVVGMKVGNKKTITLTPENAYGEIDKNKIAVISRDQITNFDDIKVGDILSGASGEVKVIEKNDSNLVIDYNHKLAGKTLIFEIELVKIKE